MITGRPAVVCLLRQRPARDVCLRTEQPSHGQHRVGTESEQSRTGFRRDMRRQSRIVPGNPTETGQVAPERHLYPANMPCVQCTRGGPRTENPRARELHGMALGSRYASANQTRRNEQPGKQRAQIDRRRIRYQTARDQPGAAHGPGCSTRVKGAPKEKQGPRKGVGGWYALLKPSHSVDFPQIIVPCLSPGFLQRGGPL